MVTGPGTEGLPSETLISILSLFESAGYREGRLYLCQRVAHLAYLFLAENAEAAALDHDDLAISPPVTLPAASRTVASAGTGRWSRVRS
jgi:hypothetical protein